MSKLSEEFVTSEKYFRPSSVSVATVEYVLWLETELTKARAAISELQTAIAQQDANRH